MTLVDNLLAYWKLDEASGNAADSSGNGNTAVNGNVATYAAGKINNGAVFDVANGGSYLDAPDSASLSPAGDISFSLWVKPASLPIPTNPNTAVLLNKDDGGSQRTFSLQLYNNGGTQTIFLYIWKTTTAYTLITWTTTLSTSAWTHLVVAVTIANSAATKAEMFINGSSIGYGSSSADTGGGATSIFDGTAVLSLGSPTYNRSMGGLRGMLDEVGFWGRTLTSTEVTTLYNGGAGLQYGVSPFVSISAPTVTTQAVSAITQTTATGNGNVTADGGDAITERGCCIGTGANPTTAGTHFSTSGTTGAYTVSMTSLAPSTHYHVRAYAINGIGTSYGADVEFDTAALPPFRFENIGGVVYDAAETKTIFAERLNEILDRLHALDGGDPT